MCLWSSLSIRLCPAFKPQHRCYSLIKQKLTVAAFTVRQRVNKIRRERERKRERAFWIVFDPGWWL